MQCCTWSWNLSIYSPKEIYGGDLITGWVADLFPYLKHPITKAPTIRNSILATPREKLTEKDGLSSAAIPTGLSRARFTLKSASADASKELELVAGFLGVRQQADGGQLEPEIGWAVVEPDAFTQVLNRFARAGANDAASKPLVTDQQDHPLRELLGVGIPKELVQLMDRFAEGQVFYEQTPHSWTFKLATEITTQPVAGAQSCMAVHFMDLADGRVVAYTTVRGKNTWEREGRILVGQLDGIDIQVDSVCVIAKGFTEFLDRLVREEGRYYFDDPSFGSEQLF